MHLKEDREGVLEVVHKGMAVGQLDVHLLQALLGNGRVPHAPAASNLPPEAAPAQGEHQPGLRRSLVLAMTETETEAEGLLGERGKHRRTLLPPAAIQRGLPDDVPL